MAAIAPETPYVDSEWVTLDDQHFAVIKHAAVRLDDLRALFDAGFPALEKAMESGQMIPAGPGLAIYQGDPMESFDLYIGFPVAVPFSESVEVDGLSIEGLSIASGDAAATSYYGSYDGLGMAWGKLMEFVAAQGRGLRDGLIIEAYVSMPEETVLAEDLRTDLYALV